MFASHLLRSAIRTAGLAQVLRFAEFALRPAVVESARLVPVAASTPLYETRLFARELARSAASWQERQQRPAKRTSLTLGRPRTAAPAVRTSPPCCAWCALRRCQIPSLLGAWHRPKLTSASW